MLNVGWCLCVFVSVCGVCGICLFLCVFEGVCVVRVCGVHVCGVCVCGVCGWCVCVVWCGVFSLSVRGVVCVWCVCGICLCVCVWCGLW